MTDIDPESDAEMTKAPKTSGYIWREELQKGINICKGSLSLLNRAIRSHGEDRLNLETVIATDLAQLMSILYELRSYRE